MFLTETPGANAFTLLGLFIYATEVLGRASNPSVRSGFTPLISQGGEYDLCDMKSGPLPAGDTLFVCEIPRQARFVSFHITKVSVDTFLNFQEIEIHGLCNTNYRTVSAARLDT